MGKKVLASFRMNDAHFTSPDDPNVSEFWKQHAKLALGPDYGYYGGCLNYASDVVRGHFFDRVVEFADLYPEVDGFELDAMRSPFFFPPGKGPEHAPLFTEMVRRIKTALAERAKRLKRPDYLLSINVPLTPELALECGLDVAAWDAERLFDYVSVGTYQAYMNHPIERWKKLLVARHAGLCLHRLLAADRAVPRTGGVPRGGRQRLRPAAPTGSTCSTTRACSRLATQMPGAVDEGRRRAAGHAGLRTPGFQQGRPGAGRDRPGGVAASARTSGFCSTSATTPAIAITTRTWPASIARRPSRRLKADVPVLRRLRPRPGDHAAVQDRERDPERAVRGEPERPAAGARAMRVRYAANGRDTRIHTVTLVPYLEYEIALRPDGILRGRERPGSDARAARRRSAGEDQPGGGGASRGLRAGDGVNYFAHALPFLDDPWMVAATGVPDMLVVADRSVRLRSKHVVPFLEHPDPTTRTVARGLLQHFRDDAAFHDSRAFAELSLELTVMSRDALGGPSGLGPRFLGHLLVELLLDAALVAEAPDRLDAYYRAMESVDGRVIQEAVNQMAPRPTERLAAMFSAIVRERFLWDYLDDARLWRRLNQVMRRVGLDALGEGFQEVLPPRGAGWRTVVTSFCRAFPYSPALLRGRPAPLFVSTAVRRGTVPFLWRPATKTGTVPFAAGWGYSVGAIFAAGAATAGAPGIAVLARAIVAKLAHGVSGLHRCNAMDGGWDGRVVPVGGGKKS